MDVVVALVVGLSALILGSISRRRSRAITTQDRGLARYGRRWYLLASVLLIAGGAIAAGEAVWAFRRHGEVGWKGLTGTESGVLGAIVACVLLAAGGSMGSSWWAWRRATRR